MSGITSGVTSNEQGHDCGLTHATTLTQSLLLTVLTVTSLTAPLVETQHKFIKLEY